MTEHSPDNRTSEVPSRWSRNIHEEAQFWRKWLSDPEFAQVRRLRLGRLESTYPEDFRNSVGVLPGEVIRVLDVGSGPISTLQTRAPVNPVQLVCVDALADVYNQLLDEYGFGRCPRILKVRGEELVARFGSDSFNYVHIANALDHCEDPALTLNQMIAVCAPGGVVKVVSIENEGVREGYLGLHQWNLEPSERGLFLWNPSGRVNLCEGLGAGVEYRWRYVDHGQTGFKIFEAQFSKLRCCPH